MAAAMVSKLAVMTVGKTVDSKVYPSEKKKLFTSHISNECLTVGCVDGKAEGFLVGFTDGRFEGYPEGFSEGCTDGCEVGIGDG